MRKRATTDADTEFILAASETESEYGNIIDYDASDVQLDDEDV